MRHLLNPGRIAAVWLACASCACIAQATDVGIKVIGVTFVEAPPNRDKNLAVFGAGPSQEKVEVFATAHSARRRFVEMPISSASDRSDVQVTAILANKARQPLGSALVGSFPKLSADAKSRTLNIVVGRLPDQPVAGLLFEGTWTAQVAAGMVAASARFEAKPGMALKFADVAASVARVEGTTLTLVGTASLARIHSLTLKSADGRSQAGERRGWSSVGNEATQDWVFTAPLAEGVLHADIYQGLETIKVPIQIVIGKPY